MKFRFFLGVVMSIALFAVRVPAFAAAPTVTLPLPPTNCAQATENVDHVICGEDWLVERDAQMADLFYDVYRQLNGDRQTALLANQKAWLRNRTALCPVPVGPDPSPSLLGQAEKCLDQAYLDRVKVLHRAIPDITPVEYAPQSKVAQLVNASFLGKTPLPLGDINTANIDRAMDIPLFTEAVLVRPNADPTNSDNWVKAATCREWFSLLDRGLTPISFPPPSEDVPFVRTSCEILRKLATAKAATVSYLPENGMGNIRLYSTKIVGCTLMWECGDLNDLAKCAPTIADVEENDCNDHEVIVDAETGVEGGMTIQSHQPYDLGFSENDRFGKAVWWTSLTVIARGDFTGDGIEDFLAEFGRRPDTSDGSTGTGLSIAGWMILTRRPGENAIELAACSEMLDFCQSHERPVRAPAAHPDNRLP